MKLRQKPLELYQNNQYSDYIDFNGDGTYLGRD